MPTLPAPTPWIVGLRVTLSRRTDQSLYIIVSMRIGVQFDWIDIISVMSSEPDSKRTYGPMVIVLLDGDIIPCITEDNI